jgi:hypothetical protein
MFTQIEIFKCAPLFCQLDLFKYTSQRNRYQPPGALPRDVRKKLPARLGTRLVCGPRAAPEFQQVRVASGHGRMGRCCCWSRAAALLWGESPLAHSCPARCCCCRAPSQCDLLVRSEFDEVSRPSSIAVHSMGRSAISRCVRRELPPTALVLQCGIPMQLVGRKRHRPAVGASSEANTTHMQRGILHTRMQHWELSSTQHGRSV